MDWTAAIDINREALKRVLAALVAMTGLGCTAAFTSPLRGGRREASGGGHESLDTPTRQPDDCRPPLKGEVNLAHPTLPRHLHRAVLQLLRPAESAARRLVVVAARGIAVTLPPPRARKAKPGLPFVRNGIGTGIVWPAGMARPGTRLLETRSAAAAHSASFALFDPMRTPFRRHRPKSSGVPRIWTPGGSGPVAVPARTPPAPDDPIDATRLGLRLAALASVLDDLPKQARRFARWRARNASGRNRGSRFRRLSPLRPGRPPGSVPRNSRRQVHEVHEILSRTHGLAFFVLEHRDTS